MAEPNPFEERARGRKVAKLVRQLWRFKTDLIGQLKVSDERFLSVIEDWGEDERKSLAVQAGCRPPSDQTWAEVLAFFREFTVGDEEECEAIIN